MGVLVRHTVPDFLFLEGTIIGLLELFLIAVGLSMDAFAVSVCKGLSTQTLQRRQGGRYDSRSRRRQHRRAVGL